ncbi:MAG: hypothetical protein J5490_08590 [Bacteroidales bacterium]|nr:hypothetical protein [Bacteroidales bacterium]
MRRLMTIVLAAMLMAACSPFGQKRIVRLDGGVTASFVKNSEGKWGLSLKGVAGKGLHQDNPVQLALCFGDKAYLQAAGYDKIANNDGRYTATAQVAVSEAIFNVTDVWSVENGDLRVYRTVSVEGDLPGVGFASSFNFETDPSVTWDDVSFLAPGLLYGDSTYDGANSPGGTAFDQAHIFTFREDFLPAPMYAALFGDGSSFTILDAAPNATTTLEETQKGMGESIMIDELFATGAFSSYDSADGGVEMSFTFPNTSAVMRRAVGGGNVPVTDMVWARRFNPVNDGFQHAYILAFRFAPQESFPELTRNSYRWAWGILKPELYWHDIEVVRTCLSDQLSSLVTKMGDRTGLPYQVRTKSGEVWKRVGDPAFYWRDPLGFVGKHIESACMLLMEGDRDQSERGQKMRQQGLDMIETAIKYIPTKNPVCMGFNLMDGSHSMTNLPIWYVREGTDDMVRLLEAYQREKAKGIDHPHWVTWCQDFADWLLNLQRPDGSLPRSFMIETAEIVEESGTTSYNIIPMFVKLTDILGDDKYLEAAIKAADYVWDSYGNRGVFIGGAIDNPNITDKEAGLLSAEAFMFLYEKTGEQKWLDRARSAADFAETWTWIWNVPMPDDADDEALNWKKGVPTVGVQGITAQVAGHTDQFLDMSIPTYVKLYKYTGDEHYYDFARILMHNCKAMLALPGRLYGMYAPGYQTENFRMGADRQGRGFGTAEKWMPWVTTNHLFGINMTEEYDKEIFDRLCAR